MNITSLFTVPDNDLQLQLITTVRHTRKVDIRLHGKGNSNSHGARPVHLIITMMTRI
jgi:hypothetical protein